MDSNGIVLCPTSISYPISYSIFSISVLRFARANTKNSGRGIPSVSTVLLHYLTKEQADCTGAAVNIKMDRTILPRALTGAEVKIKEVSLPSSSDSSEVSSSIFFRFLGSLLSDRQSHLSGIRPPFHILDPLSKL